MKILYINTCDKNIIIKLFKKNKIMSEETIIGQKNNSQFIMPAIKKTLNNVMPDMILVVIGPGSFTGVRLGVTIAKTFSFTKNIPIKTITTLEEVAISTKKINKIVAVKENNGYYLGKFDKNHCLLEEYFYLSNFEYNEYLKNHIVICKQDLNYKLIINYVLKKECVNPHSIKPVYVKTIEALK